MAEFDGNLTPAAAWADVPKLAVGAHAAGGEGGTMNAQGLAIVQRLLFLKDELDTILDRLGDVDFSDLSPIQAGLLDINDKLQTALTAASSAAEQVSAASGYKDAAALSSTAAGNSNSVALSSAQIAANAAADAQTAATAAQATATAMAQQTTAIFMRTLIGV